MDVCAPVSPFSSVHFGGAVQCALDDHWSSDVTGDWTQPPPNTISIDTCVLDQLYMCTKTLYDNASVVSTLQLSPIIAQATVVDPSSVILLWLTVVLRVSFTLFLTLLRLSIVIPFRVLWLITIGLWLRLCQLSIDLFVHRKLEAALLVIFVVVVIGFVRTRLTYWKRRNIPFESFTAHLRHFGTVSRLISLDDCERVRRFGKVFGSFKLLRPVLCIADHEAIQQILYTNSDYFTEQNTWQLEGHLLSESIFANSSADIQRWKRKKTILLSSFLSRKLKLLKPTIDSLVDELLYHVSQVNHGGSKQKANLNHSAQMSLDDLVFPWLVYSLLSLIFDIELPKYFDFVRSRDISPALVDSCRRFLRANTALCRSPLLAAVPSLARTVNLHLLNKSNLAQIRCVLEDAIKYRQDNGLLGLSDCPKRPSKRSVKFRDEVFVKLFADGNTNLSEPKTEPNESNTNTAELSPRPESPRAQLKELTFIDIILNYEIEPEDKLEGYDLSTPELVDNLTAFFTVSLGTLDSTISSVLFYLSLHRHEQTKVRQEVLDCIGGGRANITWESVRNLKYCEAFVREVLRLHPPIERIDRVVTKECRLNTATATNDHNTIALSPGMECSILVAAVHRDPQYFPEPDAFTPERFCTNQVPSSPAVADLVGSPNDHSKPDTSNFLAFGLGARTCIGLKFVMFYLKHLIANVLLEYELRLSPKDEKRYLNCRNIALAQMLKCNIELISRGKQTSRTRTGNC